MSTRSRRRRGGESEEEPANDERWMASYMDMVTVLMCMFIVLFAMSVVDQEKFEQLRTSLATGFGSVPSELVDDSDGVIVPPEKVHEDGEGFTVVANSDREKRALELAVLESDRLVALREQLRAALVASGLEHTVDFELDERGLTVRLVGSETFFESNRTALSGVAVRVLDSIGPILAASDYTVSVEGHADYRQSVHPFPTNWELSSGRATGVLRHLVEHGGMPPERIASVGFGSARPLASGSSDESLALNRRVDIMVLSDEPEAVRELIPATLDGAAGGG
ncbi:flagellar motor protein MotB [Cryobacterium sp. BB307]|uniref:OmpA/MotB family protein n=1 Tax=unclassified Cryobacterium TaxID=2649013 RepID=UPI0032BF5E4F